MRFTSYIVGLALVLVPTVAAAQSNPDDAPFECDDQFGECGTPEMSGGGCGCGGGGSILIANTDLGDTYQYADDYDDDGVEDPYDNCPRVANDQADSDGDGVGDACDNCLQGGNADQADLDGDGIGDACDDDIDGDGVPNAADNCKLISNPAKGDAGQPDLDGNGVGDACDDDIDGDGLDNLSDPCPLLAGQADGAACFPDTDGDGIGDFDKVKADKCPTIYDPEQLDTDGDGIGDACDPDMDGDGIQNVADNCALTPNEDQVDADRDGLGDSCDANFCFVVFGDTAHCLDPEGTFMVYSPEMLAKTGEPARIRLFANRENEAMRYTISLVQAPEGSRATIENAEGTVTISTPYEYHYLGDRVATFTPDLPGEYKVKVSAQTVWEDRPTGQMNAKSEYTTTITVTGPAVEAASASAGCTGGPMTSGILVALGLLAGLALVRRRG